MKASVMRETPREENKQDLVLYHGSTNCKSGNVRHLAQPGKETTLCSKVTLSYNQEGQLDGRKNSSYRGQQHVLGRICSQCLEKVQGQ